MPEWLSLSNFIVPIMVLIVVVAFIAIIKLVARNYIKVAPNEVLVKYGRQYAVTDEDGKTKTVGFSLTTGGARFVWPLIEKYKILPLDAFQVKHAVRNVPSREGVRVTVEAVATLKVGSELSMLDAAVRRFADCNITGIMSFAKEILEGGLRGVVATMTVEKLINERTEFGNEVQSQVTQDLTKLGLLLDNFLIQDISDEGGYIDALGVKRTAEVKRDAEIAAAEAKRDQDIKVALAQKDADEKSSAARLIGEKAKADADRSISDAQRDRDVQVANNKAKVQAEEARIPIKAQTAAAEEDKALRKARVEAAETETIAKTKLQDEEKKRHDAELEASLIVRANRDKEAKIIGAEATKEAAILVAEGEREATRQRAEAERIKRDEEAAGAMAAEQHAAEGRKAQAAADQAELVAQAQGEKAKLLAEADGEKAKLLAKAEGEKAELLAEAEGVLKKAEAYARLDATGKLLEVIEALPSLIEKAGLAVQQAGEGTLVPMAQAVGTGLANVDEIRIIDFGGGNGNSQDPLSRLTAAIPRSIFNLGQHATALPVAEIVRQIGEKLGIDLSSILGPVAAKTGGEVPDTTLTPVAKSATTAEEGSTAAAGKMDKGSGKGGVSDA